MALELIILGSGTSAGVPMIGCSCDVCCSTDPRNDRTRASALIRSDDPDSPADDNAWAWLIDTATEMRQQIIREDIHRIDGVLYTHGHADHVFGLDDLRRFNAVMDQPIDLRAEHTVVEQFQRMFPYVFAPHTSVNPSFVAQLVASPIEPGTAVELGNTLWTPVRLMHGRLPILGFRIDGPRHECIGYCTDVSTIPPESYPLLQGLDVLVIDALRYRHHPTHMSVEQALSVIEELKPRLALLTHIAHDIDHATLTAELPDGVRIAHDGLRVRLDGDAMEQGVSPWFEQLRADPS